VRKSNFRDFIRPQSLTDRLYRHAQRRTRWRHKRIRTTARARPARLKWLAQI